MRKKLSVWAVLFMAAVLLFMYLPMLVVVLYSFNANEARNAMAFTGFTFKWYIELFTMTRGAGDAILNTLQLALYSCGLSIVLGTLGAMIPGVQRSIGHTGASALKLALFTSLINMAAALA